MNKLVLWLKALRAPFFTAAIVPVLVGTAYAHHKGFFNLHLFLLALIGMICFHAGCNLANDFFDHKNKTDWVNKTPTPFSGGSRLIQNGEMTAKDIFIEAMIFFIIGTIIGIYLYLKTGPMLLVIGLSGAFLAFFYSAPPLWLASRGIGEFAVGIGFGALPVLGAYYVQTKSLSYDALLLSVPIGLLIAAVVYINEFPDHNADKEVNKKTLVVRLGPQKAVIGYNAIIILTYIFVILLIALKILPLYGLIIFITLPIAIKAMKILKENYENIPKLLPANAGTIQLHLSIGLLMGLSILVFG